MAIMAAATGSNDHVVRKTVMGGVGMLQFFKSAILLSRYG